MRKYLERFAAWLERRGSRREIRVNGNRYLDRYYILSTRWISIYLHRFWAADDWRFMHDHPWGFLSVILAGGYAELKANRRKGGVKYVTLFGYNLRFPYSRHYTYSRELEPIRHGAGAIIFRRAEDVHRVESLHPHAPGDTWTLFIHGRRRRGWNQYDTRNWKPVPQEGTYSVETTGILFPRVTVK